MAIKLTLDRLPVAGDYLKFKVNGVTKTFTWIVDNPAVYRNPFELRIINNGNANDKGNSISNAYSAIIEDLNFTESEAYLEVGSALADIFFKNSTNNIVSDFEISSDYATISLVFGDSPNSIKFYHNLGETLPNKSISISGNNWEIVGKPNFILSCATSGVTTTPVTDSTGTYQKISGSFNATVVITLSSYYDSSMSFTAEDLAGTFQVNKEGAPFGTIDYTVQINKVFVNPYPANQFAFTLDNKNIEAFSQATDTYFQVNMTVKVYDFFTNIEKSYTVNQKLVLFKGQSFLNIGRLIHRLMANFEAPNTNQLQYKIAQVQINFSENKLLDNTVVRSGTSQIIKFVAGLSRGITTKGFLDFNPKMNRVTTEGFALLNILVPDGSFELRTYKNDVLVATKALPASAGKVILEKVLFNTFNQGDKIDFVLDSAGGTSNTIKKSFIIFPENLYSRMIVWENEFLLQSAFEFTGTGNIKSDIEFQSQKYYDNLVEKLRYLSSTKEVKLSLNTGWVSQLDSDTIESLMRSKRVWLMQGNNSIELRPNTKSIVNHDLERELIDYGIEFIINKNYDEETYTL